MDDREARRARRREIDEMVRDALRAETAGDSAADARWWAPPRSTNPGS